MSQASDLVPSPSGLVIRNPENESPTKFEIWSSSQLEKEFHIPQIVHGSVYVDGWYENRVAHVEDEPSCSKPTFGNVVWITSPLNYIRITRPLRPDQTEMMMMLSARLLRRIDDYQHKCTSSSAELHQYIEPSCNYQEEYAERTVFQGLGSGSKLTDVSSTLMNPRRLRRLKGLRTRNLVSIAAWFGFLTVVKARSSPGSSNDSTVDALFSVMGNFGYNHLLADTWKGNDPCEGWHGINCVEGRIEYIFLASLNLTGSISKRFGDFTSLYVLDLSHNLLTGTIPLELTRMKLIRSLDLSYNQLHGKVPHFKTIIPDTVGNPEIRRDVPSLAWVLSGGAMALASLLGVGIYFFRAWKRNRSARASQPAQNEMVPHSQQNVALLSSHQSEILEFENNAFSLEILREATEDFSHPVGRGAFGSVYQGKLKDGREIAVKKMVLTAGKGCSDQFKAEVTVLSRVRHRNIVSLHGYCIQGDERLLVYEFMPRGALSKHLQKKQGAVRLDWSHRLIVALDVARGLEYLYTLASHSQIYIHRDVKSANVLLGKDLRAKIADFGFARTTTEGREPINTKCVGNVGYTAPEYLEGRTLSRKADVYSFGVVLLELISGKKAYDYEDRSEDYIAMWFQKKKDSFWKSIEEDIDKDHETQQSVNEVAELAGSCCATEAEKRPEMSQIVRVLSSLIEIRDKRNQASSSGS